MTSRYLLKNGRVLDPARGIDSQQNLAIEDGRIVEKLAEDAAIVDCSGKWVVPGLIDMRTFLREPGEEDKETIASGTRAAAAGGFTAIACMPDSSPVNDNGAVTRFLVEQAASCAARVYPVGALSQQMKGQRLAEFGEMKREGAVAVGDGEKSVTNSQLMRRAMEYASSHDLTVISHCEDLALSRGGCMNESFLSTCMGLRGIPAAAESIMVQRDLALARLTRTKLHLAHISTAQSVELIRKAKQDGIHISAETAPQYFTLTEEAVRGYDTNAKMNPPLRGENDRSAIRSAIADGTIDVIATDHSPWSGEEKNVEFVHAANGVVGLESALGLSLALVDEGLISPLRLIELLAVNPARILGIEGGSLRPGVPADITIIDPTRNWVYEAAASFSQSKNTPFDGWKMKGRAVMTFVDGKPQRCGETSCFLTEPGERSE